MKILQRIQRYSALLGYLFVGVVLLGCANKPPNWFVNSQAAKKNIFYGVGEGESLAEAKQAATNDLAQSIQTTLHSSTTLINMQKNEMLSTELQQHISLDVANLKLQNLQITNKARVGTTYYVRIVANAQDLARPLRNDLNDIIATLQSLESSCASLNIKDFATLEYKLNAARSLVRTLEAIDTSFISSTELEPFKTLYANNMPIPKISVSFEGTSYSDEQIFLSEIAKFARISKEPNLTHLHATLHTTKTNSGVNGELFVAIKDCKGNVLFQTSIKEEQPNTQATTKRIGVVLYKKLLEYKQGQESGFPRI